MPASRTLFLTTLLAACVTGSPAYAQTAAAAGDWPLHSRDTHNSGYSPLDQITPANAATVAQRWSMDLPKGEGAFSQTPLAVDGVLYVSSGSKVFAIDGATGLQKWMAEVTPSFKGGGRGPAYGDGRIYAFGNSIVYAIDATTGKPVETFGDHGQLRIVNRALEVKDPGRYPPGFDTESLGYSMTTPPTYANGTLYVGVPFADSLINGGLVIAADGVTGAIKWVWRAIPQGPDDDGWDLARDTWKGSPKRQGGGIWTAPAVDLDLGLVYVNVSNPSPNYDGSSRLGENLFTNSVVALDLKTGKRKWHFQAIHHDIWDWDLVTGPTLFDATVNGKTVKALGSLAKTCYAYILDRKTGKPLHKVVETAVPTTTDVPGEQPWPTQPVPYTAAGAPQTPFCSTTPKVDDPELARRVRPTFHPYLSQEFVITAPGNVGGPNYGPSSFSPRTRLYYVTGKNDAFSLKVKPVGDSVQPAPGSPGHFKVFTEIGPKGVTASQNVVAIEPGTGAHTWTIELPSTTGTGNFVTASDVLVQAVGRTLYLLDATSGRKLAELPLKGGTRSTPMTYQAGGRQFIALALGASVVAYGLP